MKETDDVVIEGEGARKMHEVGIGRAGITQDPAGGRVNKQVERMEFGHVVEGLGKDGVKAAEDRGDRVYGDVKGPNMACDVGFSREKRYDVKVTGPSGGGEMTVEDALDDGAEA